MTTLTPHRPPQQRSLLDWLDEPRPDDVPHRVDAPRGDDERRPAEEIPPEDERRSDTGGHADHRPTLDALVAGTWDALTQSHAASCPVCGGDMAPRYGAGPRPVAATCRDCGTELS